MPSDKTLQLKKKHHPKKRSIDSAPCNKTVSTSDNPGGLIIENGPPLLRVSGYPALV